MEFHDLLWELSSVFYHSGENSKNAILPHGGPLPLFPTASKFSPLITVLSLQETCDRAKIAILGIGEGVYQSYNNSHYIERLAYLIGIESVETS